MPDRISQSYLVQLIQRRVIPALGQFDPTGLAEIFPFTEDQLRQLENQETTIRGCVRRLGRWFDDAVHPPEGNLGTVPVGLPPPQPEPPAVSETLANQLRARWETEMVGAKKIVQNEDQYNSALIPVIQTALDRLLTYLRDQGIRKWAKVDLVEDASKGPFGYLNVIRFDSPDAPGVGIAAWLAERKWRPIDLQRRVEFLDAVPCPIRTLVLFRRDGTAALAGATNDIYEKAVGAGRDIRIHQYTDQEMESLVAFPRWLQAIKPDVEAAGAAAQATLRALDLFRNSKMTV